MVLLLPRRGFNGTRASFRVLPVAALSLATTLLALGCTLIDLDSLQSGLSTDGGGGSDTSNPDGAGPSTGGSGAGNMGGGGQGGAPHKTYEECLVDEAPALFFRMGAEGTAEPNAGTLGGEGTYDADRVRERMGLVEDDDGASTFTELASALQVSSVTGVFDPDAPFTVEMWLYIDPNNYESRELMRVEAANGEAILLELRERPSPPKGMDSFVLVLDRTAGERELVYFLDLRDANAEGVYHLVAVYRGDGTANDMTMWVNTAPASNQSTGANVPAPQTDGPVSFGAGFYGIMDEVAVYPRELTEDDVQLHYDIGRGEAECGD